MIKKLKMQNSIKIAPFNKDVSPWKKAKKIINIPLLLFQTRVSRDRGWKFHSSVVHLCYGRNLDGFHLKFSIGPISERARTYAYWFSGPMRIAFSILGTIGNILSLIVFTRPSMMATETNYILIGKFLTKIIYVIISGSCHFDRASNDKFSVEFWVFVIFMFLTTTELWNLGHL